MDWLRHRRWDLAAAGGYLVLSCMYAWRTVVHFTTHLAGHGGDGFQNLWNMWWFERALLDGANPWFTPMLHHPHGTTLLFHTLSPFNCTLALPFDWMFGQPAAYNLVFLFSFAASGFTMYLLARELFEHRLGAFLAGCVFTFSHYHFAHAQGHLNLTAMEWTPLYLLGLVRVWRRRRLSDGVLMGLALALATFCDVYYALFGLATALLAALVQLVRRPREALARPVLYATGLGAGVYLATGGILLIAMLAAHATTEFMPTHDARYWSADLQAFFVPGWISAYGGWFESINARWTGNSAECCQYLGFSVLALCVMAVAWRAGGRRPWAWVGLGAVGLVMSLGPRLHWGGGILEGIPLPFDLVTWVFPPLEMSGAPIRWHFLALVATAVLAGGGAAMLYEKLGHKSLGPVRLATPVVLLANLVVLVELAPHWIDARLVHQPDFIEEIKESPGELVVYDLGDDNAALLRQIGHEHRMMGGYISRPTRAAVEFLRRNPLLRAVRGERRMEPDEVSRRAASFGLRWLIVPLAHRASRALPALGALVRWRAGHLQVWELPW